METKNHWHLAEFITVERNWKKYKKQIVLGSIMPDINLLTYLQGHTYKDSIQMIRKNAKALVDQKLWNKASFYQLGIILHYVADYFTFPHNATFKGSLSEHRSYEKELRSCFRGFLSGKFKEQTKSIAQKNSDSICPSYNLKEFFVPSQAIQISDKLVHPIQSISDLFSLLERKHAEYLSTIPSPENDCYYIFSLTNIIAYFLPKLQEEAHKPDIVNV